jgi:hypothetical protein
VPEKNPPPTPWYHEGLSFTCTQCGRCCGGAPGFVWVSDDEERAIAAQLKLPLAEFRRRHTRRLDGRRSLNELANGDCEFLTRDASGKAGCSIYAARPLQCRTWPFWKGNLRSRRAWTITGQSCPGIDRGQHHPLPVIQEALQRNQAAQLDL